MKNVKKDKKPFYKKKWVWAIVIIVLFIAINKNTSTDKTSTSTNTTEKQQTKKEDKVFKIGQDISVGYFKYKVLNVANTKKVGINEFGKKETKHNFVVVTLEATNKDKESSTLDGSMFKLIAKDESKYESDWEASMWANAKDGESDNASFSQLNPNISKQVKIVFETPKQSTEENYTLVLSGGIASGKKAKVMLGK